MTCISKIFWKRTYLFIEYLANETPDIWIQKDGKRVPFEVKELEEGVYRGKLNLCIAEGRTMLSSGEWSIWVNGEESLDIADEILLNLENLSSVYRYDGDKAYVVTFHLEEAGEKVCLKLDVDYMMKNRHPERRTGRLSVLKKALNLWYRFLRIFTSKKGNKILFLIENRETITGNMLALYERMLQRELDKTYEINVSCRNIFGSKQGPLSWIKTIGQIAKHDFIFVEDYVPVIGFLDLDSKTTVVQTWHAGFGFKSVGYGRFGLTGSPNPFESCHRKYTYGIIGNEHLREIYSEVWGIEKEDLLASGMPRLSNFLDKQMMEEKKAELYEKLPCLKDKHVITFAPTYRGSNQKEAFYDMEKLDQKALYDFCKETDSIILMKFHPFLQGKTMVEESYKECLMDVSEYNLNDLFYVTDVLITDYSSCFYDFILLGKPVLFYVYDEVQYSATRGVHRPVNKVAPGKICRSFEELLDTLKTKDYLKVEIPEFMIDNCSLDQESTASDKIIDYVILGKKDIEL